jgi:hypothetical protein
MTPGRIAKYWPTKRVTLFRALWPTYTPHSDVLAALNAIEAPAPVTIGETYLLAYYLKIKRPPNWRRVQICRKIGMGPLGIEREIAKAKRLDALVPQPPKKRAAPLKPDPIKLQKTGRKPKPRPDLVPTYVPGLRARGARMWKPDLSEDLSTIEGRNRLIARLWREGVPKRAIAKQAETTVSAVMNAAFLMGALRPSLESRNQEIQRRFNEGETIDMIAPDYGLDRTMIWHVVRKDPNRRRHRMPYRIKPKETKNAGDQQAETR